MPFEDLRKQWDARDARASLHAALSFVDDWLVLGAETRLAPAKRGDPASGSAPDADDDARINALICAAYGRPLAPGAFRYIRRAIVKHGEGDSTLATMHLAMTGL